MPEVPGSRPLEVFTSREPWDQPSRARESSLSEDERTRSPGKKLYSDRVSPWGEGLLSAPSWGFGKGRAESNLLPSLPPCQIPSQVVQKGQFLVNQSTRLPKKQMRRMSPLASPISPGCRAGRSALTMQTFWPGWRGGRWTGATLAEGTTPCRSSREHSTQ